MREIKFRAKRKNGEWVIGNYVNYYWFTAFESMEEEAIYLPKPENDNGGYWVQDILPDTIGQFTGLYDKNDKEIYEGDIVAFDDTPYCVNGRKYQGIVAMYKGAWCVKHYEKNFDVDFYSPLFADDFANRKTIILGNIYDNPELLKGGKG